MNVSSMLPTNEIDLLTVTVTDALDFAAEGEVADGYAALVWGLRWAEEMVEGDIGWGVELARRWRGWQQDDGFPIQRGGL